MRNFGLYVIITSPQLPYKTIAEICVYHRISMLQLREKNLSDRELIRVGKQIREITRDTYTNFVINDRPDIAMICEADYLHLGQDDIPIEEARKIVGNMKIGLSTHSIKQAKDALSKKPDYIGFGPIYPTNTKAIPDKPVGVDQLKEVLQFSDVPVVAIGGIDNSNIINVINTGAPNVALVKYLMQTNDLEKRIIEIKKLINNKS
ncbi:MAG: Thiamine-phosphate synthase [Bacteroidetes bacterium ADurb.Bin035]|nr:MAG: Thiamine-phosphate synthase [Bacteroidetes bacterium ADurb.Bin035]